MKKVFNYKNARIEVEMPYNRDLSRIQVATENFLKKVIKEQSGNGNSYTSGSIGEK